MFHQNHLRVEKDQLLLPDPRIVEQKYAFYIIPSSQSKLTPQQSLAEALKKRNQLTSGEADDDDDDEWN
ncbi:hypothetical protein Glove_606g142 [Diversispora epigaea]|uniref:Uncharacterized protein n=1 Tax=Diversispora epigaea TaxID=1348612 RepID=A0A397G6Y7_9GLOM|nr:hypothetical protein Glove_606g142 [Diversispora epigaea]